MKFCQNCGKEVAEDFKYCNSCGAEIEETNDENVAVQSTEMKTEHQTNENPPELIQPNGTTDKYSSLISKSNAMLFKTKKGKAITLIFIALALGLIILTIAILNMNGVFDCKHKKTVLIQAIDATCKEDGSTEGTRCVKCGYILEKPETIPAAHLYNEGEIILKETCVEQGQIKYTCKVCGDSYIDIIEAHHEFDETTIVEEATCRKSGLQQVSCKICGYEKLEETKKLSHSFEDYSEKFYRCKNCAAGKVKPSFSITVNDWYSRTDLIPNLYCKNALVNTETYMGEYVSAFGDYVMVGYFPVCPCCGVFMLDAEKFKSVQLENLTEEEFECADCGRTYSAAFEWKR